MAAAADRLRRPVRALVPGADSLRRALAIGCAFGFGQFVIALNWIATAFTYPGGDAGLARLGRGVLLSPLPRRLSGAGGRPGVAAWPKPARWRLLLALAGAWAVTEWLRGGMFTGFAWNPVGVTLVDTPLAARSAR